MPSNPSMKTHGFLETLDSSNMVTVLDNAFQAALDDRIGAEDDVYDQFRHKYFYDPGSFMRDCIAWDEAKKESPTFYQIDTGDLIIEKKRVSVRSLHGAGKTGLSALLVHWFALTRDGLDWKCVTTASVWRQLTKYLWPEIHKWAGRIRWDIVGRQPYNNVRELQVLQLNLQTGSAFAVASDDPATIEGAHADNMFYILDESKLIPGKTFDAIEGAFSGAGTDTGNEAYALSVSTPGEPKGRFYAIQSRKPGFEDWTIKVISLEDAIKAGRVSREWAKNRKKQWRSTPWIYKNKVLAEFAAEEENGICPLTWIERSNEMWLKWEDLGKPTTGKWLVSLAADISGGGKNNTVIAKIYEVMIDGVCDYAVDELAIFNYHGDDHQATMRTCGQIVSSVQDWESKITIDMVGVGTGVFNRLQEMKGEHHECSVFGFNGGKTTKFMDETGQFSFSNCNSAAWWGVREAIDPSFNNNLALPPDDNLIRDLNSRKFTVTSTGKIKVETKTEMRDRLKMDAANIDESDSPDEGDSVAMAVFGMRTNEAFAVMRQQQSSAINSRFANIV